MRFFIFLLFLYPCSLSFAGDFQIPLTHKIKAVKKDSTVSPDTCVIYGKVLFNKNGLGGTRVSSYNHDYATVSDSTGYFELKIPIKDSVSSTDSIIYAFKTRFNENIIRLPVKGGYKIELDIYMTENNQIDIVLKPVIYLYHQDSVPVNLKVKSKGELTFTYPAYKDEWNITTGTNGSIHCKGKTYPYLFWEAEQKGLDFVLTDNGKKEGFFIATDTAISFLENTLTKLGLNDKEQTDFITFWGPRIVKQPFANIQFLVDDAYSNHIADIEVNPKPLSSRRVYILLRGTHFESGNTFEKTQEFTSFTRQGFTLIEWGGTELSLRKDL